MVIQSVFTVFPARNGFLVSTVRRSLARIICTVVWYPCKLIFARPACQISRRPDVADLAHQPAKDIDPVSGPTYINDKSQWSAFRVVAQR